MPICIELECQICIHQSNPPSTLTISVNTTKNRSQIRLLQTLSEASHPRSIENEILRSRQERHRLRPHRSLRKLSPLHLQTLTSTVSRSIVLCLLKIYRSSTLLRSFSSWSPQSSSFSTRSSPSSML